jgi:hypothetical protein
MKASATEQKFIDVTEKGQSSSASRGCEMAPPHPDADSSIKDEGEEISSNIGQVHVDVIAKKTAARQDQNLDQTAAAEPTVRRSTRSNKGVPARRLSCMV